MIEIKNRNSFNIFIGGKTVSYYVMIGLVVVVVVYLIPCPSNNYCFPQDIYQNASYCALFINCVIYGDWKFAMLCKIYIIGIIFRVHLWGKRDTVIELILIVQLYILFCWSSYLCPRKPFFVVTEVSYILKVSLLSPC